MRYELIELTRKVLELGDIVAAQFKETHSILDAHATSSRALLALLLDKGVMTIEEFEAMHAKASTLADEVDDGEGGA